MASILKRRQYQPPAHLCAILSQRELCPSSLYVQVQIPASQKVALFGDRLLTEGIKFTRGHQGGPQFNMIGVLVNRGNPRKRGP